MRVCKFKNRTVPQNNTEEAIPFNRFKKIGIKPFLFGGLGRYRSNGIADGTLFRILVLRIVAMPVEQIERVSVKQVDFCHQHIVPVVVVMGYDRMGQYGHIGKQYEEYVYCLFHNAVGKNSFYFRKIKTSLAVIPLLRTSISCFYITYNPFACFFWIGILFFFTFVCI